MLIVNIKGLIQKKSTVERRKISYKDISEATGIRPLTLTRIVVNPDYNFKRSDLEKLLIFFDCEPNDLLTLIREEEKPLQQG